MSKSVKYIVVRIKDNVTVLFEDEFINKNEFYTQNIIIEVLGKIYDRKDFSVELYHKQFDSNEDK